MRLKKWLLALLALFLLAAGCAGKATPPAPAASGTADPADEPLAYTNVTLTVRKDAETVLERAVESDEELLLVREIVFDSLVKSAAWEGLEVSELEAFILLSFDTGAGSARQSYYQYDSEGRHVLQMGEAGMYTVMSDEAYDKLLLLAGLADKPAASETDAAQKGAHQLISAKEAKAMMDEETGYVLLDVRTEEEFAQKRIPGAVLIPDYELASRAEAELPDQAQRIYVYCRTGRRSAAAAKALVEMGYENVLDLGGIVDWPYETVSD